MGGGSNNAQRAAEQQEAQRQAAIRRSTGEINAVFDDPARQGQVDQLIQDTLGYFRNDLDRQKANTDRSLKFAMARSGLTGGSASVDANRQVGEDYLRGVVEASRRAQEAGANLQMQDENARQSLLAMAQSGLDATTAASRSASMLQGNLQSGRATATANGLGDMFGNFADLYKRSREAAAERRGVQMGLGSYYQPMYGGQ